MKSSATAHRSYLMLIICSYLLLGIPLRSESQEAKFADLLITNNAGQMLVYARVMNCFTQNIEAAILAGVPTTFTFLFDFYQERPYWWDKKMAGHIIKHTLKYDNLKKMFYLTSTSSRESATFQTFESAKRAMSELNGVAVYQTTALAKDRSYYLNMKAKLDQVRLPFHMESLFFFVSAWDFETDWYKLKITYKKMMTP